MSRLHFEEDEPTGTPVCEFDFDFELFSLRIPEFKELIFEEIKLYHGQEGVDEYEALKQRYPKGHLYTRYPKERLRTMYKQDPSILAIYKTQPTTTNAEADTSTTTETTTTSQAAASSTNQSAAAATSENQWVKSRASEIY